MGNVPTPERIGYILRDLRLQRVGHTRTGSRWRTQRSEALDIARAYAPPEPPKETPGGGFEGFEGAWGVGRLQISGGRGGELPVRVPEKVRPPTRGPPSKPSKPPCGG
jgi:hypothetical protein